MRIFHGSEFVIERPQYGLGKRTNDYGLGFYCTEDKSLAGEWSVTPLHDGYINEYELNIGGLKVLNLDGESFTVLHWLAILLENRTFDIEGDLASSAREYLLANFRPAYEDADIIIGYRANDSYFSFARTFLSGALSYANLSRAIRLGNLGLQIVIKSRRAFDALAFTGSVPALRSTFLDAKERRDTEAREEFRRLRAQPFDASALYMLNIGRSREFWAGWALAQYQWRTGLSFVRIEEFAPLNKIILMYSPYHEMDIGQFFEALDDAARAAG